MSDQMFMAYIIDSPSKTFHMQPQSTKSINTKYLNFTPVKLPTSTPKFSFNNKARNLVSQKNSVSEFSQSLKTVNILASRKSFQFNTVDLENFKKPTVPKLPLAKISSRKNGIIKAYAANTHSGMHRYFIRLLSKKFRNYNEDRVSITLNIVKPNSRKLAIDWPQCSMFGIFDGHGGSLCAESLRDKIHKYIIAEHSFPSDPTDAILKGFARFEKEFLINSQYPNKALIQDKSGSCAILALFLNEACYIANVGDSRAFMCGNSGKIVVSLSTDHKPDEPGEYARIIKNGGTVYKYFFIKQA